MLTSFILDYVCDFFPDYTIHYLSLINKLYKKKMVKRWNKIYRYDFVWNSFMEREIPLKRQYIYPIAFHASIATLEYNFDWNYSITRFSFLKPKTWLALANTKIAAYTKAQTMFYINQNFSLLNQHGKKRVRKISQLNLLEWEKFWNQLEMQRYLELRQYTEIK